MIPYAQLRPGPGFRLGSAGFYFIQRLATPPVLRRVVARAIASGLRWRHGPAAWGALEPGEEAAVNTLHREGLALMSGLVDAAQATRMLKYFRQQDVFGADGYVGPLERLPHGGAMPAYALRVVLENPDIRALINSPRVLRVVSAYLGCKPTLSSIGVRWSFPGNRPPTATQNCHRDPNDWKFLKRFVYLTEVDEDCGPNTYVEGSNRSAGQMRARPYPHATVERDYPGRARAIMGPRGTAFMADTYGIHAGVVPTGRPRLMLQAQYSLLPILAFDYSRIEGIADTGGDDYVNRLMLSRSPERRQSERQGQP